MGWIFLILLIIDWIVMFIKFSKALKHYQIIEKGEDDVELKIVKKYIEQFFACICVSLIICVLILIYSALE